MLNVITHTSPGVARPLVIAHGLYGSARNWNVISKRMSDRGQVIAVDMRNHGESPWSDSHTYLDLASDLADVIETLDTPVDVLGHSMGGKAAMMLALEYPDLLQKLIIADIAPVTYTHSQLPFIEKMRQVDLSAVSRRSEAAAQLSEVGVDPALQSFFTQSLDLTTKVWRLNLDALEQAMPDIMSFPQTDKSWNGRPLFLSGGDSDYVLSEYRPRVKKLFPRAIFAKIPKAGHWLHAEKPREFEAALRRYLDT